MLPAGFKTISVDQAHDLYKTRKDVFVLDVRTAAEWDGPCGHIGDATLIPHDQLDARWKEIEAHKDKAVLAVCYTGMRSQFACQILAAKGFKELYNVQGGMMLWHEKNYEHVAGKPTSDMPEC